MKKRNDLFRTLLIMMFVMILTMVAPMTAKADVSLNHDSENCENLDHNHFILYMMEGENTFYFHDFRYNASTQSWDRDPVPVIKSKDVFDGEIMAGYVYYEGDDEKMYLCHDHANNSFSDVTLDDSGASFYLKAKCSGNCGNSNCEESEICGTYSLKSDECLNFWWNGSVFYLDDILSVKSENNYKYNEDYLKGKIKLADNSDQNIESISQPGTYRIIDAENNNTICQINIGYKITFYTTDGEPSFSECSAGSFRLFTFEELEKIYPYINEQILAKGEFYWSTDPEGNNLYKPGDTIEVNSNISIYPIFKDSDKSDKSDHAEIPNSSNNSQPAKEEIKEEVKEEPVVTRTYTATENTTSDSWNKAYVSDGNNSHGNLGNHYKAVAPASISNNDVSGWDSIKTDIASKTDSELAITAYEVNMNTSTRVDNSTLDLLSSKELPYARFKLENKTTFVLPTNLSEKNTETFASASDNKANFYIDITSNTTNDVNNKVIDTQFVPLNLIKSVKGNENSRIIAVRTNNQDLTNIGAVKLARTDASKTKVSLYLYDKANNALKPCGTYDYDANGMAVVYVSLTNWNLVAVEE